MEIYLNSTFLPAAEAHISVADRGFRHGDGVFETIPVANGAPYQWAFHLRRLEAGLAVIHIAFDTAKLEGICRELLARNGISDGLLRIAVSRGAGGRGYLPPPGLSPTLVIETLERPAPPGSAALWLSRYEKISPRALPVRHKLAQGLQSTLARLEAQDHKCSEALLLDAEGRIAEAAAANIFWLQDNVLYTPSLKTGALEGATRHAVLRLSPWQTAEGEYSLDALRGAEAVLLTNSAYGVIPAASLAPQGWSWESAAAAAQLQGLLSADMSRRLTP